MDPKCSILSAKSVQKHGLFDKRWTMSDKRTQYRGIIKLHVREAAIKGTDSSVEKEIEKQHVTNLVKKNAELRQMLDFEIKGDAQLLRNILAYNKPLQRAYQNHTVDVVLRHLAQDNFHKRKRLDILKVTIDDRVAELIKLKFLLAESEDSHKRIHVPIVEDRTMFALTAKFQDMQIKILAALSVRQSYTGMKDIMQQDAMYFDRMIEALNNDGIAQSKSLFACVQMGQLATEYLDDRRSEFTVLEKKIKKDMKSAKAAIAATELKCAALNESLAYLTPAEFDKPRNRKYEPIDARLTEQIEFVEDTLKHINTITNTSSYPEILPILQDSRAQSERLKVLKDVCTGKRDRLKQKVEHARLQNEQLLSTIPGNRDTYLSGKKRLLENIEMNRKCTDTLQETLLVRRNTLAQIKVVLQHLAKILERVQTEPSRRKRHKKQQIVDTGEDVLDIEIPQDLNADASELVQNITKILTLLMKNVQVTPLSLEDQFNASLEFRKLIERVTSSILLHEKTIEKQSLISIEMEDSQVPTRAEIKNNSLAIVAEELARAERECR